jgi:hypothetical protein
MKFIILFFITIATFCECFQSKLPTLHTSRINPKLSHIAPSLQVSGSIYSFVLADAESSYKYGEVVAPSWVLPVGAILVILTAAIPILLRPGEKALVTRCSFLSQLFFS